MLTGLLQQEHGLHCPSAPFQRNKVNLGQLSPDTELMKRDASTLGQTQLAPQLSPGKAEAGAGVAGSLVPKHLCSMKESQSWQCPCPTGSDVTSCSPVSLPLLPQAASPGPCPESTCPLTSAHVPPTHDHPAILFSSPQATQAPHIACPPTPTALITPPPGAAGFLFVASPSCQNISSKKAGIWGSLFCLLMSPST